MEVGDALADGVVVGHEGAVGFGCCLDGPAEVLHGFEQVRDRFGREIGQRLVMGLGDDEDVAWKDRSLVEEGQRFRAVEHDVGRRGAGDDGAEHAVGRGHARSLPT